MLKLVVLISGGGSNLHALLKAAEDVGYPARVVAIGADRDADGLEFAERFEIPSFTVPFPFFPSREAWGEEILRQVRVWQPDLVVLSGFMRLLPPAVVEGLRPNLINTHPSFLPAFPGAHAVRDALAAGVTKTGASIIVVDNGVDSGPIVAQEPIAVLPGDTEESLHERIKVVERALLVDTVRRIAERSLVLETAQHTPGGITP